MKTITLFVPDEVYEKAANLAAERETSVNALVLGLLKELDGGGEAMSRERHGAAVEALFAAMDSVKNRFSAGDRLSREELYDTARRSSLKSNP